MRAVNLFKRCSIGISWAWLFSFSLLPILLIVVTSFLQADSDNIVKVIFSLESYKTLFDVIYLKVLWRSIKLATVCTVITLPVGYFFALLLMQFRPRKRLILLLLVIAPFWVSSLIRTYSILAIMKAHGPINLMLQWLGIIQQPIQIIYSDVAIVIGMIYNFLPFMILPLYASLEKLDRALIAAAYDLGASTRQVVLKIILPFSLPGVFSGSILVFLPAMTLFYIADLLGSSKSLLLGNVIQSKFLIARNWPLGAALTTVIIVMLSMILVLYHRLNTKLHNKEHWL